MKMFIYLIAFMFISYVAVSQSFTVAATPPVQSLFVGETANYTVTITPLNGFSASVFLSAVSSSVFKGSITFDKQIVNLPYSSINLLIKASSMDTGIKSFTVIAKNGSVQDSAVISLFVQKNAQWARIKPPLDSLNNLFDPNKYFRTDNDGNPCLVSRIGNKFYACHFRNKQWEIDTIEVPLVSFFPEHKISFAYDRDGVLWISTWEELIRYDGKFVSVLGEIDSITRLRTVEFVDIDRNNLPVCMGSLSINGQYMNNNYTIARYVGGSWEHFQVRMPETKGNNFRWGEGLSIDTLNQLWIPTFGGIVMIKDTAQKVINRESSGYLQENYITKVIVDKDNDVWCSYSSSFWGLGFLHGKDIWKNYDTPSGKTILDFFIDNEKNAWICSGALYKCQGNSIIESFNTANSPLNYAAMKVIQDKDNNIWVMTALEFYVYNPNGLVNIPQTPLSVETISEQRDGVSIFPNPSSSLVTITGLEGSSSIKIVNSLGNQVLAQQIEGNKAEINISSLPSGLYFANIRTASGAVVKPIIVSR